MWNTIWPISSNIFGDYKMNNNEILARWQGRSPVLKKDSVWDTAFKEVYSDYLNDDAAAMSLLDTLVEKGFRYLCYGESGRTELVVLQGSVEKVHTVKPTRREASIAACLEVARKEVREEMNWQPIETAPKGGKRFLASAIGWQTAWEACYRYGKHGEGFSRTMFDDTGTKNFQPTHWMPLPEPPKDDI